MQNNTAWIQRFAAAMAACAAIASLGIAAEPKLQDEGNWKKTDLAAAAGARLDVFSPLVIEKKGRQLVDAVVHVHADRGLAGQTVKLATESPITEVKLDAKGDDAVGTLRFTPLPWGLKPGRLIVTLDEKQIGTIPAPLALVGMRGQPADRRRGENPAIRQTNRGSPFIDVFGPSTALPIGPGKTEIGRGPGQVRRRGRRGPGRRIRRPKVGTSSAVGRSGRNSKPPGLLLCREARRSMVAGRSGRAGCSGRTASIASGPARGLRRSPIASTTSKTFPSAIEPLGRHYGKGWWAPHGYYQGQGRVRNLQLHRRQSSSEVRRGLVEGLRRSIAPPAAKLGG